MDALRLGYEGFADRREVAIRRAGCVVSVMLAPEGNEGFGDFVAHAFQLSECGA